MVSCLDGPKPISEPTLQYCKLDLWDKLRRHFKPIQTFSLRKILWKMSPLKCRPFCIALCVLRNVCPLTTGYILFIVNCASQSKSVIYISTPRPPIITIGLVDMTSKIAKTLGLVQYCSNSSALAMKLLQSCTKPSIWLCERCIDLIYWTMYLICYSFR